MRALIRYGIKPMLPIWAMAAGLPFVIRVAMPEDGDFAFLGLGLGCAIVVARAFSRTPDFGEAADRSEPIEPASDAGPSRCGHRREEAADDTVPLPASAPRRLTECTERTLMLAVLILVISLFWIGTVALSIVLAVACHHRLTLHPIPATA